MRWSPERVETLSRLWAEGLTARAIAERLDNSVTRNAVIGKAHRLNLQRGKMVPRKDPDPEPVVIDAKLLPRTAGVEPWMCRWPIDEPGKHKLHICGKTAQPGRPYCAEHCTEAYLSRRRSVA